MIKFILALKYSHDIDHAHASIHNNGMILGGIHFETSIQSIDNDDWYVLTNFRDKFAS